jgi:hypothetical protein
MLIEQVANLHVFHYLASTAVLNMAEQERPQMRNMLKGTWHNGSESFSSTVRSGKFASKETEKGCQEAIYAADLI